MSNCVFAYPDLTLTATLSGAGAGTWTNLDNLKNQLRSKVATTPNPNSISIRAFLGTSKQVGLVALIGHNATPAATARIRLYSSSSYADAALIPGSDSGTLKFWDTNWYPDNTSISAEDAAGYVVTPDLWHVYPANLTNTVSPFGVYIQIDITDTANSLFQLGRLFVAKKYTPQANFKYGAGFTWKEDISLDATPTGVEWIDSLARYREISGTFGRAKDSDTQLLIMDRQRQLGISGELYFVLDPASATGILKTRAMLCRFIDQNPLLIAAYSYNTHAFTLKEKP